MAKILWLPSWYPSKESPQNGDFICRHAQAVAKILKFNLLFVYSSPEVKSPQVEHRFIEGAIGETTVKFPNGTSLRFFNFFRYLYNNACQFKRLYRNGELPDLVHVHVSFRAGIFALWLRWRYGVRYIITEHWTFFAKERRTNYVNANAWMKLIIKLIFNHASYVLPVSRDLEFQLKSFFPRIRSQVVPNVVDPNLFFKLPVIKQLSIFKFIHVSSLNDLKNPSGIIRTFQKINHRYPNVILEIVGNSRHELIEESKKLVSSINSIIFHGPKEHFEVAGLMRASHAFVLFSTSENLPCVIAESLCSGVPVISSSVGGVPEMLDEENGILVPPSDEDALFEAMEFMILNYGKYDREKISETAQAKYNPAVVGRQIVEIYKKVLAENDPT